MPGNRRRQEEKGAPPGGTPGDILSARRHAFGAAADILSRRRPRATHGTGADSDPGQGLLQVGDEVRRAFNADGQAQQIVGTEGTRPLDAGPVLHQTFHRAEGGGPLEHCRRAATVLAAASPPAMRRESMAPKPPCICRAATAWPGWEGRPG